MYVRSFYCLFDRTRRDRAAFGKTVGRDEPRWEVLFFGDVDEIGVKDLNIS